MRRFIDLISALISLGISLPALAQNAAAFQWIKQVDTSGQDAFAGLGIDAVGNTYIAGSTYASNFPVKNAAQSHSASAGLYQVNGPGSAYTALGLSSAYSVAIDLQNPNTIYAVSNGGVVKSVNGGATFTALSLPSSNVWTLAVNPSNGQILYAGTFDQGLFKSTDGGATWAASNGSIQASEPGRFEFQFVWIDPNNPNVVLGYVDGNLYRSADAGASWQPILSGMSLANLAFDTAVPGLVYLTTNQGAVSVSHDDGQTFTSLATPAPFGSVLPDPTQSGRLFGLADKAIYVSTDSGASWTQGATLGFSANYANFAADWAHGFLYTSSSSSLVRVTTDLKTVTAVGPPSIGFIGSIAVANGAVYVAAGGTRDVYVTKLDASGNIIYSTYFGGSGDDIAAAMTVDPSGNVYVTGTTSSLDFPVTKGAYASTGSSFVFKLNPDGSVGYSTFGPAGATPAAIAVDASGAAYMAGTTLGGLATTPGAYQPTCSYCGTSSNGFFGVLTFSGFASKLDSTGATLVYSTYVGQPMELAGNLVTSVAIAADGTAYFAGAGGILHLNAAGSTLLGSAAPASFTAEALGVAPDGTVYAAGTANTFPTTAGAFQTSFTVLPMLGYQNSNLPASVIARWDSPLHNILDATFFGGGKSWNAIAFDAAGNIYLGGGTSQQGLPTRTPIQLGFAPATGFVSELSGDLSTLLFSGYFGDTENFSVGGLGVRKDGSVVLGGLTGMTNNTNGGPFNPWVNSLTLVGPPALRVDSVVNAASLLDGAISAGETIVVQGAGFGANPQLSIGGSIVPATSSSSSGITASITATVPTNLSGSWAEVEVSSGGVASNQVLVQVAPASPAIFSQNGSGSGQGYILNKNGTLNTPGNPAAPGDPITVFATGVGPVSSQQGYAVSQYPVNVFIDGIFANGIEAFMTPVPGLPGDVYQIQVYVPDPAALVSANPNFQNFTYPPLVSVTMTVNGGRSQNGITLSISQ